MSLHDPRCVSFTGTTGARTRTRQGWSGGCTPPSASPLEAGRLAEVGGALAGWTQDTPRCPPPVPPSGRLPVLSGARPKLGTGVSVVARTSHALLFRPKCGKH